MGIINLHKLWQKQLWEGNGSSQFLQLLMVLLMTCLSIETMGQNNPPSLTPISQCTEPLTPTLVCFPSVDDDGDLLRITNIQTIFGNGAVLVNDSCFRFSPLPGFEGMDSITIEVCDNVTPPACASVLATIQVGCIAPVANRDFITISPTSIIANGTVIETTKGYEGFGVNLVENDDGICSKEVVLESVINLPRNGVISILDGASVAYKPKENFSGLDSIRYTICNECPLCDTTTVVYNVQPRGDFCNTDIYECMAPFSSIELCPEFCKFQSNEIFSIAGEAEFGTINLMEGGCGTYVPNVSFAGVDIVRFTACDAVGECEETVAFITIEQMCGENPPVANDDELETEPGFSIVYNILDNDFDNDGQEISITEAGTPDNGAFQLDTRTGEMIYSPDPGFLGVDSFTYKICDPTGLCDEAIVRITVFRDCFFVDEYCTEPLTPVNICIRFCDYEGTDTISIVNATTTFNCSITLLNDTCFSYTPLPGFLGVDLVTIIGCDGAGICDTAYTTVSTGCITPDAENDFISALNNDDFSRYNILGNDFERCGYDLMPDITRPPRHGSASINEDLTLNYVPDPSYEGLDTLFYIACNDCEDIKCDTAMVVLQTFEVGPTEPIFANPDIAYTPFNTSTQIAVLQNDEGNNLRVDIAILPKNGDVEIQEDGTIFYIPDVGYSGTDYFFYEICDAEGFCEEAIVSVIVLPEGAPNIPPIPMNDALESEKGEVINIDVLNNDRDPEGQELTVTDIETPRNSTASINDDGTIRFEPNPDFTGSTSFEYTVCDPQGACVNATITVAVGASLANNAPTANPDRVIIPEGSITGTIDVLRNDEDGDFGDILNTELLTDPIGGNVELLPDGSFTYTVGGGFQGTDYVLYRVCDDGRPILCDTSYVSILIGEVGFPPVAIMDTAYTIVNNDIQIDLLLNDFDEDHPNTELTVTEINVNANNGMAILLPDNEVRYIPNAGFVGTDTFSYVVCDPTGGCDSTEVLVIVSLPVDGHSDIHYTFAGEAVEMNVLANDIGIGLVLSSFLEPDFGTVERNEEGNLVYTPNPDFIGTDYFYYEICDVAGNCDRALVGIVVRPTGAENLPPTAQNDFAETISTQEVIIPILANDTDPEGDELEITLVEQGSNGMTLLTGDQVVYLPDTSFTGLDYFRYVICDSLNRCDTAEVVIGVGQEVDYNLPPMATDDQTTMEKNSPAFIEILQNDFDPNNGDAIMIVSVTEPTHGTLEVETNGIRYTPALDYEGLDHVIYVICDDGRPVLCDTAYVALTILDELGETDVYVETQEEEDIEICIENFLVVDFPIDSIIFYTFPENGSPYYTFTSDSCFAYSPDRNFTGIDEMVIGVCEVNGQCDSINVRVNVLEGQDNPIAVSDYDTTYLDTPITVDVLANDRHPDGEDLVIANVEMPNFGTRMISDEGVRYFPQNGFLGVDSFKYTISDSRGLVSEAYIYIYVSAENPEQVSAVSDRDTTKASTTVNVDILNNDFYPQEGAIIVIITQQPENGRTAINNQSETVSVDYTPNFGFSGVDVFEYELCVNGDCNTATVTIIVLDGLPENCQVVTPKGFSPNLDGKNDVLNFPGVECYPNANFTVYNRWGDRVYSVVNYTNDEAWGGFWSENGQPVPDGTYFYILDLNTGNADDILQGYVELLR